MRTRDPLFKVEDVSAAQVCTVFCCTCSPFLPCSSPSSASRVLKRALFRRPRWPKPGERSRRSCRPRRRSRLKLFRDRRERGRRTPGRGRGGGSSLKCPQSVYWRKAQNPRVSVDGVPNPESPQSAQPQPQSVPGVPNPRVSLPKERVGMFEVKTVFFWGGGG